MVVEKSSLFSFSVDRRASVPFMWLIHIFSRTPEILRPKSNTATSPTDHYPSPLQHPPACTPLPQFLWPHHQHIITLHWYWTLQPVYLSVLFLWPTNKQKQNKKNPSSTGNYTWTVLDQNWLRLKPVWNDRSILSVPRYNWCAPLSHPSFCMHACKSWTLTAQLQRRIQAKEMRCYRSYYTYHTKTMLPMRKSVPRSSRQSDHMKTSWLP